MLHDPAYEPLEKVLDLIHEAGGVAVLAHPSVYQSMELAEELASEGRIDGVQRFGRSWMIPKEAQKPADLRKNRKGRSDISHV